jgi:hypothetical protein
MVSDGPTDVCTRNLLVKSENLEANLVLSVLKGSHVRLAPRKQRDLCQKHGGACKNALPRSAKGSKKRNGKIKFPPRQERWKETQFHKAVFCAFEQEKGQAEKAIKNNDAKNEIHCHGNSNFASEKGNGSGSVRENSRSLGESL